MLVSVSEDVPSRPCHLNDNAATMLDDGIPAAAHPALAAMQVQLGHWLSMLIDEGGRILLPCCCQRLEVAMPATVHGWQMSKTPAALPFGRAPEPCINAGQAAPLQLPLRLQLRSSRVSSGLVLASLAHAAQEQLGLEEVIRLWSRAWIVCMHCRPRQCARVLGQLQPLTSARSSTA